MQRHCPARGREGFQRHRSFPWMPGALPLPVSPPPTFPPHAPSSSHSPRNRNISTTFAAFQTPPTLLWAWTASGFSTLGHPCPPGVRVRYSVFTPSQERPALPVSLPSIPHSSPLIVLPELPPVSCHVPDPPCPGKHLKEFCGHVLVLNVTATQSSLPRPARICRLFRATLCLAVCDLS